MARILLEVLAVQNQEASFPNRKTGLSEKVPFVAIAGIDSDWMDSLIKVKLFKVSPDGVVRLNGYKKGSLLNVRFRSMAENKFERAVVINAQEIDVQLHDNGVKQAEPVQMAA